MPTPKPVRRPKIRRIGHSIGISINPALLAKAGLAEGDAVDVTASQGEIRIQRAGVAHALHLTSAELGALAVGDTTSRAGASVVRKARKAQKVAR
jgi:antitoxin component of MazEF toxin-antitoxin module